MTTLPDRVLTVTNMYPSPQRPAYGSFVAAQVEALRAEGLETEVYFIDGRTSRSQYLSALAGVRSRIASGRFALVHAHYGYTALYPLLLGRLPVVVTFHGSDVLLGTRAQGGALTGLKRRLRDFAVRRASAVIVQTQEMKEALGLDAVRVIPMGIDLERFRPLDRAACRGRLGYEKDKRYILFPYDPARPVKNFALASRAVDAVRRAVPSAELKCVFGVPPAEMPLHYNAADLMLLTSLQEGSPNCVKEALACNLPVVATPCGDVAERLAGVRLCAVAGRSEDELASAILGVLSSSSDPRSDGRERMTPLGSRETARRILSVYDEVLGRT
jgi:glycosyltransferase involved in cell wall biosynthesis